MDNPNQIEEHMLLEVLDDSLELDDGSRWSVTPGGIPTIQTWIPTTSIRVRLVDTNSIWPYELTNTEEGISVRARKK